MVPLFSLPQKLIMVHVLIIDDKKVVRKGVKLLISGALPEAEFVEAEDAVEAFLLIPKKKWDIIILDINMPGRSGINVLRDLKEKNMPFSVLIFSLYFEDQLVINVYKLGACGYLIKDKADVELVKAVKQILSGQKYIMPFLKKETIDEIKRIIDLY